MPDTITVTDAEVRVWHQNQRRTNIGDPTDPPDDVIHGADLDAVSISSRAGNVRDEVSIDTARGDYDLRVGDRVQLEIGMAAFTGGAYGEEYGTGYGGDVRYINWAGRVQPTTEKIDDVQHGALSVDATDWPGGVLGDRTVTGSWTGADVGAIIREIVDEVASEVDASGVPDLGTTTDQFFNQRDAWDAVVGLAAKADTVITQAGNRLNVDPITNLTPKYTLTPQDYGLPWDVTTDDDVKNIVRVDSGFSRQLEEAQTTVDSSELVTESTRLTHKLGARKASLHSIELYIEQVADDEDMKVRLQAEGSNDAIDVTSPESDIVSTTLPPKNLPDTAGWVTFFLPDHTLPERGVWMILETTGATGHRVGGDSTTGTVAFESYYPHPVNFETSDRASIAEYGPREIAVEKDNLKTLTAAREAARQELARRAWPEKTITFPARSPRAHSLEPGDVVTVDDARLAEPGDYIVTERAQEFDASTVSMSTEITATWRKGVLAP